MYCKPSFIHVGEKISGSQEPHHCEYVLEEINSSMSFKLALGYLHRLGHKKEF